MENNYYGAKVICHRYQNTFHLNNSSDVTLLVAIKWFANYIMFSSKELDSI